MGWYFYIAIAAIVSQALFVLQIFRNYRYALMKYQKARRWYRPRALLIIPCKGMDSAFEKNVHSFFHQDYDNYLLWFVVADGQDPAYKKLLELRDKFRINTKAKDVRILTAGASKTCSQKLHNLLYCYKQITDDIEVMAFADSDACIRLDWLSHIVYPLRNNKYGASSGYRWFVPQRNNIATLAASAINAKVAQLLGNTIFNQAWGGSMAISVKTFREIGLDKIWEKAVSDDLSLSYAVKKAGMKLAFVPACLVASHEAFTWAQLFEFGRRQFLITRVYCPRVWWFALLSNLYSILGLWAGLLRAIYAAATGASNTILFAAVPVVFFVGQLTRAIVRQRMIRKLLKEDWPKMKAACAADISGFWVWSLLTLILIISSAWGKEICWRGIKYKLQGPLDTIILDKQE
jgi:cellulose synthase/poly-beta-1,6-N-acetylglucosamine synthase-like glycosyltransferase